MGWKRTVAATIAGIAAAVLCVAAVEAAAHSRIRGDSLFAAAAGAQLLGAVVGSAVATAIARGERMPAWIIAAVLALLTTANLLSLAHPVWFLPVALAGIVAGTIAGTAVARRQEYAG